MMHLFDLRESKCVSSEMCCVLFSDDVVLAKFGPIYVRFCIDAKIEQIQLCTIFVTCRARGWHKRIVCKVKICTSAKNELPHLHYFCLYLDFSQVNFGLSLS